MIVGVVTADGREATIPLLVRGPRDRERVVRAVIDTGFTGLHMLPPALLEELELDRRGSQRGALADGSEVELRRRPARNLPNPGNAVPYGGAPRLRTGRWAKPRASGSA